MISGQLEIPGRVGECCSHDTDLYVSEQPDSKLGNVFVTESRTDLFRNYPRVSSSNDRYLLRHVEERCSRNCSITKRHPAWSRSKLLNLTS